MGIFDLHCALSGLSTSWPGTDGPATEIAIDTLQVETYVDLGTASDVRCSMLLLEQIAGTWKPFTLPVSGFYNFYGRIAFDNRSWEVKPDPHAEWVGRQLLALWEQGVLVPGVQPDAAPATVIDFLELADPDQGGLRHAVNGTAIASCLYLDEVANAIALPGDEPEESWFGDVPEASREARRLLHRVVRWIEPRGGFTAKAGGAQHTNAAIRESAQRAWKLGDPGLQRVLEAKRPEWTKRWCTADDRARQHAAILAAKPTRPYRPGEAFRVGEVIEHPKFGRGSVEELVAPNKLSVRFTSETKLLVHKPT